MASKPFYNLIMHVDPDFWIPSSDLVKFDIDRLFEHTINYAQNNFISDREVIIWDKVIKHPALFLTELQSRDTDNIDGYFGVITSVHEQSSLVEIGVDRYCSIRLDRSNEPLMSELDIDPRFEVHRTHWAMKSIDLCSVLTKHRLIHESIALTINNRLKGTGISANLQSRFTNRYFHINDYELESDLVCVMFPFNEVFERVKHTILKACQRYDLVCKDARDVDENPKISDDIYHLIVKSSIVICDISCQNPNVLYEMGLCHALDKTVIVITSTPEKIPFDVHGYRHIPYERTTNGLNLLFKNIQEKLDKIKSGKDY